MLNLSNRSPVITNFIVGNGKCKTDIKIELNILIQLTTKANL